MYSCLIAMTLEPSRQFQKTKFHENLSSGSRPIPHRRTDGQTDRHDELTVTFHNFANAPNNSSTLLI